MSVFLAACRKEPVSYTPIWLMRQAGRYQAEYRAIRDKVSFIELCHSPELAAEVTVFAVDQLGVDAAIIFADILLILEPLGVGFEFTAEGGPKIHSPIRNARAIDAIAEDAAPKDSLGYVMEAIRRTRAELGGRVPLIGFCGAPFTLASYMIEGGGSKHYAHTKQLMYGDEGAWNVLMAKLTRALTAYLNAQIDAGAQAVQVFDSWVGCLSPQDYRRYVQPHMKRLFSGLNRAAPVIHFGTGNPRLYPLMAEAGGDVIGIDWRVELDAAWSELGDVGIMGNLDSVALLGPEEELEARAQRVLDQAANRPGHIFNLGHGILPMTDPDRARALVDYVHEASARGR